MSTSRRKRSGDKPVDDPGGRVRSPPEVRISEGAPALGTHSLPPAPRRRGQGVKAVRQQPAPAGPLFTAAEAAVVSMLFPHGRESFVRWVGDNSEINLKERRPMDFWEPLLIEFASRPIHGHRRRQGSTNHRRR